MEPTLHFQTQSVLNSGFLRNVEVFISVRLGNATKFVKSNYNSTWNSVVCRTPLRSNSWTQETVQSLSHSEWKVVSSVLREELAWPHKPRTTCSWMSKDSLPSSRDQLLAFANKDPAMNYLVLQALLVNSATAPGEVTKGETFASKKNQGRAKCRRCEKWDNKCFWPIASCTSVAALHIPGNYMGLQGNTTNTPGSTREKTQISLAALWRLLAAAAAMKLTMSPIRITLIKLKKLRKLLEWAYRADRKSKRTHIHMHHFRMDKCYS